MTYANECFSPKPASAYDGHPVSQIVKTYRYGRHGDMEVNKHENGAVSVYYAPSCLVFYCDKQDAQDAWNFAAARKQHLRQIGC